MWIRRAEDELGVGVRIEVERVIRRLEDRELAGVQDVGDTKAPLADRDPANGMRNGRLVAPGFAGGQAQNQVVQRGRKLERARNPAVGPDKDARRAVARDGVGCQVDVFGWSELLRGRQTDPGHRDSSTV